MIVRRVWTFPRPSWFGDGGRVGKQIPGASAHTSMYLCFLFLYRDTNISTRHHECDFTLISSSFPHASLPLAAAEIIVDRQMHGSMIRLSVCHPSREPVDDLRHVHPPLSASSSIFLVHLPGLSPKPKLDDKNTDKPVHTHIMHHASPLTPHPSPLIPTTPHPSSIPAQILNPNQPRP